MGQPKVAYIPDSFCTIPSARASPAISLRSLASPYAEAKGTEIPRCARNDRGARGTIEFGTMNSWKRADGTLSAIRNAMMPDLEV